MKSIIIPLILLPAIGSLAFYFLYIIGCWDTVRMKDDGRQFSIICTAKNPELVCSTDNTRSFIKCMCINVPMPRNIIEQLDYERELDCKQKTMVKYDLYGRKQTKGCKIINNYSPNGVKWIDDCGREGWAYSETQCGEEKYFGWRTWSNSKDEKNIWIDGQQYYRSCMYTAKEEDGCEYDINKWEFKKIGIRY